MKLKANIGGLTEMEKDVNKRNALRVPHNSVDAARAGRSADLIFPSRNRRRGIHPMWAIQA